MSTEQSIVTQALSNLGDISIANGYSFDVSGNVFEWQDSPLDDDSQCPGIIFRDVGDDTAEDDDQLHVLNCEILVVDVGDNSPTSIRAKKQDVLTAMALLEQENYVERVEYHGSEKEVERMQKRMAVVTMRFGIAYYALEFQI
jgi:hypothetical protein